MVAIAHLVVAKDAAVAPALPFLYAFPRFDYTRFSHSLLTIRTKARCYAPKNSPLYGVQAEARTTRRILWADIALRLDAGVRWHDEIWRPAPA